MSVLDQLPEYLTTDEVAAVIRMDRDYVSRQCKAKNLAATKVGKEWRIHREDLRAFMAPSSKVPATRYRKRAS